MLERFDLCSSQHSHSKEVRIPEHMHRRNPSLEQEPQRGTSNRETRRRKYRKSKRITDKSARVSLDIRTLLVKS